ncbi:MAG: EAL domain-containing protein [Alphaproteobacteria bacterium]|nr:EAL domain-containing protein [Alphaproteobacteria bacterium]
MTLGSWGALLAALAVAAGLAGCLLGASVLVGSLGSSAISESRDRELRTLTLTKANRDLMHGVEELSSGARETRTGGSAVRSDWHSFEQLRDDYCRRAAALVARSDALPAVCASPAERLALIEREVAAFDPPDRLLSPAARKALQALHADVMQLHDDVLEKSLEFENDLAQHYDWALWVLTAAAFTSALSALALVYFVRGTSARYDAKWQEANRQHRQINSIIDSSGAPFLLVDRDLRAVLGNREFHKLGLPPGQENANPFHLDPVLQAHWRDHPVPDPCEPALYATDLLDGVGRRRLLNVTATPIAGADGSLQGVVFVAVDDTERWQTQQALVERARYDRLTGLANRGYFFECARQNMETAVRKGLGFAMLCLDVDDFTDVNGTMGYAFGDSLLRAVAARVRAALGPSDLAARFGADELTVMRMDVREAADAERFARQLLELLRQPYDLGGTIVHNTTSIGVSIYGAERIRAEVAVGQSDMALHRAKSNGHGGLAVFTPSLEQEVRLRARLAQDMHQGLGKGQFFLVYQPRFNIRTNAITGVEALLRWRHPTDGLLSPSVFIPVAESGGFIHQLGTWAVREACRQMREWCEAALEVGRVAVNVSALQFRDAAGFERALDATLAEAGLPAERLELEITESAFIEVTREHWDLLRRLRARGMTIALDDFGTGYSSLVYLRSLPADRIKLAQVFVEDIADEGADTTIAEAAVLLGRGLGLEVTAEGVERPEQLAKLKLLNCDEAQGYLLAKPMLAEDLARFVRSRDVGKPC